MERKGRNIICLLLLSFLINIFVFTYVRADYWVALPPYNVLWPLWSPALSPINPITGLPTPLISSLTSNTILPVQPAIIWDPASPEANNSPLPWLAYNIPDAFGSGLIIWDQYYGLRPFPLDYMLDPLTGLPAPIPLPLSYWLLKPIDYSDIILYEIMLGNSVFANTFGVPFSSLLTPQAIWGLPVLSLPVL